MNIGALGRNENREQHLRAFLETQVWPYIPDKARQPWTKDEEDALLGYGEWGEPV